MSGRRNLTEIFTQNISPTNPQNEQKLKPSKFSVWLKKHTPQKSVSWANFNVSTTCMIRFQGNKEPAMKRLLMKD